MEVVVAGILFLPVVLWFRFVLWVVRLLFVPSRTDESLSHGGIGRLASLRTVASGGIISYVALINAEGVGSAVDTAISSAQSSAWESFIGLPTIAAVVTVCALGLVLAAHPGQRLALLARAWIPPVTLVVFFAFVIGVLVGSLSLSRWVVDALNQDIDPLLRIPLFFGGIIGFMALFASAFVTGALGTYFALRHMFRASQVHPVLPALTALALAVVGAVGTAWGASWTGPALFLLGPVATGALAAAELVWLVRRRGIDPRSAYAWVEDPPADSLPA